MTVLETAIEIAAPPDRVWRVLGTLDALDRYDPGVTRSQITSDARTGIGATRRCDLKPGGFCGVVNRDLLVRVGPEAYQGALARPHARPMDFTGRPLTGFVFVGPSGSRTDAAVATWLRRASEFVSTLPARKRRSRRPRPRPKRTRAPHSS